MFHDLTLKEKDITGEMFELGTIQHKVFLFHTLGRNRGSGISFFLKG